MILPFNDFKFSAPVLPDFYWNVYSNEQRIKHLCFLYNKLVEYSNNQTIKINSNTVRIDKLEELFKEFVESGFDDYYREQVEKWISENLDFIFTNTAKQVYFGLTDDGYFCAYIPESWSDISFDTGAVYGRSDYGRLILRFDAEGQGVINNTYSYTLNNPDKAKIIADLETVANVKAVNLLPASDKITITNGYYIQNGKSVIVDAHFSGSEVILVDEPIISNLPTGDSELSAVSAVDSEGSFISLYISGNELRAKEQISANSPIYINGVYISKYSNI